MYTRYIPILYCIRKLNSQNYYFKDSGLHVSTNYLFMILTIILVIMTVLEYDKWKVYKQIIKYTSNEIIYKFD